MGVLVVSGMEKVYDQIRRIAFKNVSKNKIKN